MQVTHVCSMLAARPTLNTIIIIIIMIIIIMMMMMIIIIISITITKLTWWLSCHRVSCVLYLGLRHSSPGGHRAVHTQARAAQ